MKAIREANEAADSANAVATGVHKREGGPAADGAAAGSVARPGKPKPTPEAR